MPAHVQSCLESARIGSDHTGRKKVHGAKPATAESAARPAGAGIPRGRARADRGSRTQQNEKCETPRRCEKEAAAQTHYDYRIEQRRCAALDCAYILLYQPIN